jgi:hypothetical protein
MTPALNQRKFNMAIHHSRFRFRKFPERKIHLMSLCFQVWKALSHFDETWHTWSTHDRSWLNKRLLTAFAFFIPYFSSVPRMKTICYVFLREECKTCEGVKVCPHIDQRPAMRGEVDTPLRLELQILKESSLELSLTFTLGGSSLSSGDLLSAS